MDAPTVETTTTEKNEEKFKTRRVRSFAIRKEVVPPKEVVTPKEAVIEKPSAPVLRIDRILANPGDTIRWEVDTKHKISIWFPHAGVFVTPVIAVMHEGSVEATIRDDVLDGVEVGTSLEYEYAIFDHTDHEFVTCESHPKLVIPKPGP